MNGPRDFSPISQAPPSGPRRWLAISISTASPRIPTGRHPPAKNPANAGQGLEKWVFLQPRYATAINLREQNMPQQGLVVFAKSKKRVSAFYQQTLGLEVIESDSSHDLLRNKIYELVIHTIPRKYAAGITITKPPEPREETPFKPTFVVNSLAQVRSAAEATGGYLKPEAGAWHFRGHIVLDGWDPEGNIVQFKQAE